MSDIFSLSLKLQKETNCKCWIFPFSTQILKAVSFKVLCCHDNTWLHLNFTLLKPWADQPVPLMEKFVLSYVNKLYIYQRLSSSPFLPKTPNQLDKPVLYTHANIQSLSRVRLFVTPWTAARQGSWSITNSQFTQTHVHWVGDAIQPLNPLSSPSPPALTLSQHQVLFKWVSSSHQVAKLLEFQLQHQSFQWTPRTDRL